MSSELLWSQDVGRVTGVELFPHSTFPPPLSSRFFLSPQFSRGQKMKNSLRAFSIETGMGGKRPWHRPFVSYAQISPLVWECLLRRLPKACLHKMMLQTLPLSQAYTFSKQSRRFATQPNAPELTVLVSLKCI